MKIESFYPVLMSERVAELSAFYQDHFGFTLSFETDWYVRMRSDPAFELAILDPSGEFAALFASGGE